MNFDLKIPNLQLFNKETPNEFTWISFDDNMIKIQEQSRKIMMVIKENHGI